MRRLRMKGRIILMPRMRGMTKRRTMRTPKRGRGG